MRIAMIGRYYNRQGGVSAVMAELSDRAGVDHEIDIYTSEALDTEGSPARFIHVPMLERPAWLQVPTFAARLRGRLDPSRASSRGMSPIRAATTSSTSTTARGCTRT